MLFELLGYLVCSKLHKFKLANQSGKQKIRDVYLQSWHSMVNISSSSNTNYKLFKQNFEQSKYITLSTTYMCQKFLAFRTINHRVPVEVGRWSGQPLQERKCTLCTNDIGDEYHYLLTCNKFSNERHRFLKPYFYVHPNVLKYNELMNSANVQTLKNLCIFVDILIKSFKKDSS